MYICTGSLKGIEIRSVEYENGNIKLDPPMQLTPSCRNFTFSPNLKYVAFYTKSGIHTNEFSDKLIQICHFNVKDGTTQQFKEVPVANIAKFLFSPNGTYFAVILRRNSVTEQNKIPLVQIYQTEGGLVRSFNYAESNIPKIFWSEDEKVFASSYSNGISFFKTEKDGTITESKLELPHLLACDFANANGKITVAVVYNDQTGNAKRMKIFEYPNLEKHLATRPVMVGESFSITISPNGYSAIAIGQKNQTGETYFGESFPYYLNIKGQQKLQLKKSGPVHSIQYSRAGDRFVTIAGHSPPAVAVHFDRLGTSLDIGQFSFNTSRFSVGNNLIAFGGFGNFAGAVKVYDSQTRQTVADGEALYTSSWDWSPCGRLFYTAVLYPKMMISNEFRIHNHCCQALATVKMEELTQCEWVGLPDPKPLPKINTQGLVKPAQSAYVPPHLRGKMAPSNPAPAPVNDKNLKRPPGYGK